MQRHANARQEEGCAQIGLRFVFSGGSALWLNLTVTAPVFMLGSPYAFLSSGADARRMSAAAYAIRLDNNVLPARQAGMRRVFLGRSPWGVIRVNNRDAALNRRPDRFFA
jgi:hypothetical protein